MNKLSIYDDEADIESAYRTLEKGEITEGQRELIRKFDRYLKVNQQLSVRRRLKYIRLLTRIGEMIEVEFENATKEDIERLVEKISDNSKWKDNTKRDFRVFTKRFYKWLKGNDEEYPKMVKWIKTTGKAKQHIKRSELITPKEVEQILSVAENSRDKAFIHVLYESGTRISEIGTLRIKDINFDRKGCLIHVAGKTGERPIRLVKSVSDLSFWYNHHPQKDKPEAPLWCSFQNTDDCLTYTSFVKILKKHFRLAGIKKKCNPHRFRHSYLTVLSEYLSDQQLKQYAGWSRNSKMIDTYCHLTGGDVADKILEIHGIKTDENKTMDSSQLCPRCQAPNNLKIDYCYNCHHILNEEIAYKKSTDGADLAARMQNNPEAMVLIEKLAEVLYK